MKKILALIMVVLLSACSVNQGTFTVISKNVVDLDNIDLSAQEKIDNVYGVSRAHIVIFFPFGEMNPNVESAMNDAFRKADGDLFTDATVKSYFFYIPYIYGQDAVTIEGDVIKTRK